MAKSPEKCLAAAAVAAAALLPSAGGFVVPTDQSARTLGPSGSAVFVSGGGGMGFGTSPSGGGGDEERGGGRRRGAVSAEKTYGESARAPIGDIIDSEGAMAAFFSSNEEWAPLFRSFAAGGSVPAMSFLGGQNGGDVYGDAGSAGPWRRLDAIPPRGNEEAMGVLASFLDSMQQSLVDIPVSEVVKEDEDDLHFIEEGRRMLVVQRFHVLSGVTAGDVNHHEELFATCWSELAELRRAGEADTGSLILLPDYDLSDLRRFADMNLQRPLDWLGVSDLFEVASLQRDSPAIRLIHKLSDIPEL